MRLDMELIYLDHNSTSPIAQEVIETMMASFREGFVNPASQHRPGQRARRRLERLRAETLQILGANPNGQFPDQLVFTSGGTESNNLAIAGLVGEPPGRVLISAIEHPSVLGAAENLVRKGFTVQQLPVDKNGVVVVERLREQLEKSDEPEVRLVCLMLANNETGVIQPVKEVARICHDRDVLIHCDAVQAVAKIKVNFRDLGVDSLAFTAHKFQGPRGIGGLIFQPNLSPRPLMFGGFQQLAIRPGTEDVTLAAGLHRALELFAKDESRAETLSKLRDHLQGTLLEQIPDGIVNGSCSGSCSPHAEPFVSWNQPTRISNGGRLKPVGHLNRFGMCKWLVGTVPCVGGDERPGKRN